MSGNPGRFVTTERLDYLPSDDPLARASRVDLQRVHRLMRSVTILRAAVSTIPAFQRPRHILELGAGDGTLMLRFAQAMQPSWAAMRVTMLDRQDLVSPGVRQAFAKLGWQVTVLCMDALEWAQMVPAQRYDLCITTLFLHHFEDPELVRLLRGIASHTNAFVACEPRRSRIARTGSRLIGLLGANEVTREDSVKSVAAGFNAEEITELWPRRENEWHLDEYPAWPFTHCFRAVRTRTSLPS
jgi:2-polyprenyl-3-methyl-5-hydroxy-6-metoxy-1,4-benzoquinol methylase